MLDNTQAVRGKGKRVSVGFGVWLLSRGIVGAGEERDGWGGRREEEGWLFVGGGGFCYWGDG